MKPCLAEMVVKHAQIQKVLSEGSNFDYVFFFRLMSGGMIQIPLLAGHQLLANEKPFKSPFRWRANDGLTLDW